MKKLLYIAQPERIFLGNGDRSGAACYELHRELERAFDVLGGIQQPGCTEEEIQEGDCDVQRIARYIYETLTGYKIVAINSKP